MPDHELDPLARIRKWAHKKLLDEGSGVYQAFFRMEGAATYRCPRFFRMAEIRLDRIISIA